MKKSEQLRTYSDQKQYMQVIFVFAKTACIKGSSVSRYFRKGTVHNAN